LDGDEGYLDAVRTRRAVVYAQSFIDSFLQEEEEEEEEEEDDEKGDRLTQSESDFGFSAIVYHVIRSCITFWNLGSCSETTSYYII
jgi:hypothetical protein